MPLSIPLRDSVRDREIGVEQEHLDRVYRRLEEKIHEAEFLMHDAAKRGQVGTPGALAERDAQVFRAGVHLNRLNNEFEDFLFGRIDLLLGKDGKKGPDGAYTSVEPAEDAVRDGQHRRHRRDAAHRPDRRPGLRLRAAGHRLAGPGRRARSTAPPRSTPAGSYAAGSSAPRAARSSASRTT